MSDNAHVVIIGGGISGLSAAYDLAAAGIHHTLIEKQPRLGGCKRIDRRVNNPPQDAILPYRPCLNLSRS